MSNFMDDENMQTLLQDLGDETKDDEAVLNTALVQYPDDARLHFLKGSTFAGSGRLIEAHAALTRAVDLSPDFHIARFQLGFFQLTSGESDNALKTWARLDGLPKENYLRVFVIGLRHLIRDELEECQAELQRGMLLNEDNLPLNNDMQLIITQITPLIEAQANEKESKPAGDDGKQSTPDEASLTSILLQQSNQTSH